MKTSTAIFETPIEGWEEAQSDYRHPLLTTVRFVFADDKPNANGQGIEYSDFPDLSQSAIDMPIKVRYLPASAGQDMKKGDLGGHLKAVTIGHIRAMAEETMDDGTHRLVAEGVLYREEFPDEVAYLKDKFDKQEPPGLSWEINYKHVEEKNAVKWLKGVLTRAATFVKFPAYGTRTSVLALASDVNLSEEELIEGINKIIGNDSPKNQQKGGSNTVEENITELQNEIAELRSQLEAANSERDTAKARVIELEAEVVSKDEVITAYQHDTLVAERTRKAVEAGLKLDEDQTKRTTKQEFWANLSEDAFAEYLADIQEASKAKAATASVNNTILSGLPRVNAQEPSKGGSVDDLRARMRSLTR